MTQQADFAALYAEVSGWQRLRGLDLMAEAQPRTGETVLDLGCGTGGLTVELARRVGPGGRVVGVDPDSARLELAGASLPPDLDNLHYLEGSGDRLATIRTDSIDLVYSNYVIHWIPDTAAVVREAFRCLRPGGRLAFELPDASTPLYDFAVARGGRGAAAHWAKLTFRTPEAWRRLLGEAGFVEVSARHIDIPLRFPDLETFYDWFEGTTHGDFRRQALSPDDRRHFAQIFAGGHTVTMTSVRLAARKPAEEAGGR